MSTRVDSELMQWAREIVRYSKNLDPKNLEANAHLPPLEDHRFHVLLPPSLLVRESYLAIYEYAKTQCLIPNRLRHGLVVLGQPGIGKTAFLFYALVRALHEGIPVAWCQHPERQLWLQFSGEKIEPYCASQSTLRLALYDDQPPKSTDGSYIVQATCPERSRYRQWSKQSSAMFWVMKNWTLAEIDSEATHRGIDTTDPNDRRWYQMYSPQKAFSIVGPSARRCLCQPKLNKGNPIKDFSLVNQVNDLFSDPEALRIVLRLIGDPSPARDDYPHSFHETFFVQDVPDESQPLDYGRLAYRVGTNYLLEVIRLQVLKETLELDMAPASIFATNHAIGVYIYESFVRRRMIRREKALDVFDEHSGSPTPIPAPANAGTDDFDPKTPPTAAFNTLYLPIVPNFPSLDFFYISDNHHVVMIQTTISQKPIQKNSGIEQVIKFVQSDTNLAPGLKNLYFVFAAPDASSGIELTKARSVNGEMTISGLKIKVGYIVVPAEGGRMSNVLCKLSSEKALEEMEEMDTD